MSDQKTFPLVQAAFDQFDRFLDSISPAPIGVAVSGGSDSTALLYLLYIWAKRPLHVFCVDHGINPLSAAWCRQVEALAHRLGARFTQLDWTGEKPQTGLQSAARLARHRLLAEAARQYEIRVLCLGHTADDVRESAAMRVAGSNVGDPQIWSPSPVWPQGRGVFILRPLLEITRQVLRAHLTGARLNWIDDPANANPKFLRSKIRLDRVAEVWGDAPAAKRSSSPLNGADLLANKSELGDISLKAQDVLGLERTQALRVLGAALVSVGGGGKLPRGQSLVAIYEALVRGECGPWTLSGARLKRQGDILHVTRSVGDMRRAGTDELNHAADRARLWDGMGGNIWDGRFEITSRAQRLHIVAAQGHKGLLAKDGLARFLQIPPDVRGSLPLALSAGGPDGLGLNFIVLPPDMGKMDGIDSRCWVRWRFLSAVGDFASERELIDKP